MPAVSKNQQKAAGIALSAKRDGTVDKLPAGAAKDMAKSMTEKELEKYASTEHKGLPKKKQNESAEEVVNEEMLGVEPGELASAKSKTERLEDKKEEDFGDSWLAKVNNIASSGKNPMSMNTKGTRVAEGFGLDTVNNLQLIFESNPQLEKQLAGKSTEELNSMLQDYEKHAKLSHSMGMTYEPNQYYDMIAAIRTELGNRGAKEETPKGQHQGVIPGTFGAPGMAEEKDPSVNESYAMEQQNAIDKFVEEVVVKLDELQQYGELSEEDAKIVAERFIENMIESDDTTVDLIVDKFDSDSNNYWTEHPQKAVQEALKNAVNVLSTEAWNKFNSEMQTEAIDLNRWNKLAGINEGLFSKWDSNIKAFAKKLGDVAVEVGDKALLKVADKLVGYDSFMTKLDPEELANHLTRNLSKQQSGSPYRDADNPVMLMKGQLETAARALQSYDADPKFAKFASDFLITAANAL